jgi:ABC-2 type transport system ATP-binding protein
VPTSSTHTDAAVRVQGLSKSFRLPHEQVHTLKERVLHPLRRRTFDELAALRDIDFEVAQGEFFGIVGRNGSGKSTLLKCLAGIYRADVGDIWLRGRMSPFIELGVGFNPDLTARDNVILNAIMLGLTPAEARARYDHVIAFAELESFVDLKLKNYSSGMHVRLAFSVMIQVDADLLLIDEVLAVGDAAFQQKCHDTLNRMRDEGRTILLVTHDMQEVERFCDRAMLVERGRIVAMGDPHEVAVRYNEMNFAGAQPPVPVATQGGGDGGAVILDTWFADETGRRVEVLEQGHPCALHVVFEAREALEHPVAGVQLVDDQHRTVFATSTQWKDERTGSYAPGERAELVVRFDNIFAPGRYHATPTITHRGGGAKTMDRRERMASVVVTGTRSAGGLVDLPHDLELVRVGAGAEVPS